MRLIPLPRHDLLLGLCCLPALLVIYLSGFTFGQVQAAGLVASGALTLAFGANKTWGGSSFSLLFTTTLGVALSSGLGCLAGNVTPLYIAGAMLYAAVYVTMANVDDSAWWMLLQWSIAWLVSGYFAGSPEHAADRAMLVGAGGLIQMFFLYLVFRRYPFYLKDVYPRAWLRFLRVTTGKYKHKIHLQWSVFFALMAMGLALSGVEFFHLKNGYWAGMTLLICLRNNYRDSLSRVRARVSGTLMGSIAAAALIDLCDSPLYLIGGFMLFGYAAFTWSYSLIAKSYFVFAFIVTMMVVFMIASLGTSQIVVATHRLETTAIGGLFALFALVMTRLFTRKQILLRRRKSA
ncbi:FUSC family protein [Erwinia sp. 198]|uniref:FUSC family protein n=1 Tax=Erwinia sp. 198 TaxID=2022746 RepID=UPI000F66E430|nr:FUSC family protein [Erwinia sp. 198]RRZ93516.1 FUSC family protein [Erwinia sp. 198]